MEDREGQGGMEGVQGGQGQSTGAELCNVPASAVVSGDGSQCSAAPLAAVRGRAPEAHALGQRGQRGKPGLACIGGGGGLGSQVEFPQGLAQAWRRNRQPRLGVGQGRGVARAAQHNLHRAVCAGGPGRRR